MSVLLVIVAWRSGFNSDFQKAFLLLTVIFAALFLIVAGYSDDQTAPVFSLLGAIIGYLFGRTPSENQPTRQQQAAADAQQELAPRRNVDEDGKKAEPAAAPKEPAVGAGRAEPAVFPQ
ncbi:hypothetical protein HFO61_07685 [Rhizobium leguminosarum]|nr:hypothetical protein [Rhizobium leguminosarum]MBY5546711.1 hypothetical protein [Rhizobium leguminosarum]